MTPKRVAIVKAGEWGDMKQDEGHYDRTVELLEDFLRKEMWASENQPKFAVAVVPNTSDAFSWLGGSAGAIVYISRGMLDEAHKIASEHPRVRVVLYTGAIPEGEVVILSKISGAEAASCAILG